ncbi:hypothetical protein F7Q99_22250 [Streptomyces kaniharaensis]|uniref:HTH luxR-type domain-containing protein n=1 Tax=Streptomyces kaniharaensis TaxID=212423 RepID=A0A6N7KXC6_9ACTN|nr:response regulator transcription factor [Streptomyces kaniharaensis]MQS14908.1 hypothetical protein [Streptomyces kaniharaensis]
MVAERDSFSHFSELDDTSAAAYGQAVRLGEFERDVIAERMNVPLRDVERAEAVLRNLRLLQPMPGRRDVLVPIGPEVAAADLVGDAERQIRELQQAVTSVRSTLISLMPTYFEGRRERNSLEAFDIVNDADLVQSMIDEQREKCRSEVLMVQPGGPRPANILSAARDSATSILSRGVKMRTIYQHTARSDLPTRAYVRDIIDLGGEFRTCDELIDRIFIYDREVAFLPDRSGGPEAAPGAAIVREPVLVNFLCSVFDYMWNNGSPFTAESTKAPAVADDLKTAIVRLMVQGHKDEMVARRLGMSVRTCRRHIAEITEDLQATSRFQAGYNVAALQLPHLGPPVDTDAG